MRFKISWSALSALGSIVLCAPSAAFAQGLPGPVQPGAVERGLQQKLPAPAPDQVSIPAPQGFEAPTGAANYRFRLHDVQVGGANAISATDLRETYAKYLGRDVSLANLYAIARAITDLYARRGYALSFAMVPAQQIDKASGDVRLDVIEGYVAGVQYSGDVPAPAPQYGRAITQSRPLRTSQIERALLLMNDLPGTTARGVFQRDPSLPAGGARLDVALDQDPVTGSLSVDNRGTRAFGPWRASASIGLNSLLGQGEQLTLMGLKALNGDALNYGSAHASLPVGGAGWVMSAGATYTDSHPGTPLLTSAGFASSGWTLNFQANDPVLRSRDESLWLWGGGEAKWLRSDLATTANSRDYIFALQAGATWNRQDIFGVTAADLTVTQGLPVFGATTDMSPLRSRLQGSATFTALSADITRLQPVGGGFSLYLAGSGQFASRGLLAPEQCGYGGANIGRGFDSSEIVGDHCLQGLVELRYDWDLGSTVVSHLQPYLGFDAGAVWNTSAPLPGSKDHSAGESVSVGTRAQILDRFELSVEYALPIGRDVALEGNRDGRVFAFLGVKL